MKKILIVIFCFSFCKIHAQVMQAKPLWATILVSQLKCWQCKERLNNYLLRERGPNGDGGVIKFSINMNTATLRIQYYPDKISLAYLQISIANAGFDADTVKAEPDAYKVLPPICKRKEDGGGPEKGKPCNIEPQ